MKVLIACEFSGVVREAFRERGHNAISCDLLETEKEGKHYKGDLFDLLYLGWDLIIAHPPCTHLAVSGNRWYAGTELRKQSVEFVERIWGCDCKKLAIENPVGVLNSMSDILPKPQYIQPWMFGHGETKKTGIWKRGLPDLIPTNIVDGRDQRIWKMPPSADRSKERSKTYQGIAKAMADQWGHL